MCSQLSPSLLSSRAARTNPAQWSEMLNFFMEHPEMVTKSFTTLDARQNYRQLWDQLSTHLNSMGYGSKSTDKWIDAFTKWKSKVKVKAQQIRLGMKKTGGGGPLPCLTQIEEKLMDIVGWTIVDGDGTPELGFVENISLTPSLSSSSITITKPCSSTRATVGRYTSTSTSGNELIPIVQPTAVDVPPLVPITQDTVITQSQTPNILSESEAIEDMFIVSDPNPTINVDDNLNPGPSGIKQKSQKRKLRTNTSTTRIISKSSRRGDHNHITLSKMHEETMSVLRDINVNIGKIADKDCKCKCCF